MRARGFDCWTPAGTLTEAEDRAAGIVRLIGLAGREHVAARYLSYGQRRLLEIGVALAGDPELLLLDEPTSGLGMRPMETLRELVRQLSARLTIVVIEHDMDFVLTLSHHVAVLHRGRVIAEGPPAAIQEHAEVREAYLGRLGATRGPRVAGGPRVTGLGRRRPVLLAVEGIDTFYGDAQILRGLSLEIRAGEAVCLLGRNGRGKTTTIKSILGLVPVRRGRIAFDGQDITRLPTHLVARRGIAWVPDNRRVFPTLTVERNLAMALNRALPPREAARGWTLGRVYERFPILGRLRYRIGEHLSGGEAQLVAIARALLMHPRLVLMDEPSQGLAPRIVEDIMAVIQEMRDEEIALLLVEQNSSMALGLADRAYVIDDGRIVHAGPAAELEANPTLKHRLLAV